MFKLVLKKWEKMESSSQRRKGPTRLSNTCTGIDLGVIANGMGNLYYCECTIDMQAYILIVQKMIVNCHQDYIFPGKQDNARPHSARATTEWSLDTAP